MRGKLTGVLFVAVLLILSLLTLIIGSGLGGLANYVVITLLLIYALMIFFVRFERGRHTERELVLMSIMCAIAVASRAAFIWIPHFKPMAAIIMIAGIAFGARSGFLVGTVSVLLSNFIFGQGPWTPWQMVSFGMCGMLIGLLADSGVIPRFAFSKPKLILVAMLAALEVLLISGLMLDVYALTSMIDIYTPESVIAILLAGLPVNAIQAFATFITLLVAANPILAAIHRACIKYGLSEDRVKV